MADFAQNRGPAGLRAHQETAADAVRKSFIGNRPAVVRDGSNVIRFVAGLATDDAGRR
jgi:hypothetical protein